MTRFLAELTSKVDIVIQPTPSNDYPKHYNVYELDISPYPDESYWIDWGGYYDNFTGTQLEIYYEQYLNRTQTVEDLLITPFSIYLRDDFTALINIPMHPWLYPDYATEIDSSIPFLSSTINPDNPSANILRGVNALIKFETPSFDVKLSEAINGIVLNQSFNVTFFNNDSYFDDNIFWNLLNRPLHLKKATAENPSYNDFKTIRTGLVDNTATTFDNLHINVSDRLRTMEEPACKLITQSKFPALSIENNLNKSIPIVYGKMKVRLLQLNETHYVAAEYITEILDVIDRDGNSVDFDFSRSTNTITSDNDAAYALIVGYTNNNIGSIVTDLISRRTDIPFTNANWNMNEVNQYIENSSQVNILISRGNVRRAIQDVLRNDMTYLIQQMDGRLTLRRYGIEYTTHTIPSWLVTKIPKKINNSAQDNFFSSCIINYNFSGDEYDSYLYDERAGLAENTYKRRITRSFNTDLTNQQDARKLAQLLANRFTTVKQTIRLAVGVDTSDYELLDYVEVDLTINNREFNKPGKYFVKEINPAQDTLLLEEI